MSVREHYQGAISDVLSKQDVRPLSSAPSFALTPQSTLREAIQYTDWYCHRGDSRPHYRFRRYYEALSYLGPVESMLSHVDIGCGAGAFSWSLLDWAELKGLNPRQVRLFGLDRSPAMIQAADMIRNEIAKSISDYPTLHYYHDTQSFLSAFRRNHHPNADSVITLGHVLAQSHCPTNLRDFTEIISAVRRQTDPTRGCRLAAVDAKGHSSAFLEGWNLLLQSLENAGMRYTSWAMPQTQINSSNDVKLAAL